MDDDCSVCGTDVTFRYGSTWCKSCEAWVLDRIPLWAPNVIDLRDKVHDRDRVMVR